MLSETVKATVCDLNSFQYGTDQALADISSVATLATSACVWTS